MKDAFYTDVVILDSTAIERVHYDNDTKMLYIDFHNGARVGYENVPRHQFDNLVDSPSPGSYYNIWIRGVYRINGGYCNLIQRESLPENTVTEKAVVESHYTVAVLVVKDVYATSEAEAIEKATLLGEEAVSVTRFI